MYLFNFFYEIFIYNCNKNHRRDDRYIKYNIRVYKDQ